MMRKAAIYFRLLFQSVWGFEKVIYRFAMSLKRKKPRLSTRLHQISTFSKVHII